ncbi:hypothetical protein KKY_2659 [Pelagibacterium halotolerans B2]|uniref:Uncharacterized protein n=2 Tax=Pelagibacterium TaxID=1082930 RepID=G4RBJ1_PELHB|nr:hypothetical protein KKY_2659 [Pelagibacterium halotolerans B2]
MKPTHSAPDGRGSGAAPAAMPSIPPIGGDDDDDGGEGDEESDSSPDPDSLGFDIVDVRWGRDAGWWTLSIDDRSALLIYAETVYGQSVECWLSELIRVARDEEHFEKLKAKAGSQLEIMQDFEEIAGFVTTSHGEVA